MRRNTKLQIQLLAGLNKIVQKVSCMLEDDGEEGAQHLWEILNHLIFWGVCDGSDSDSPELYDVVENSAIQPQVELSLGPILNTVKNIEHSTAS